MARVSLVELAQAFIAEVVEAGDIVVDATMGNGCDTEFLAKRVGPSGKVYAFDIQSEALENTRKLLQEQNLDSRVELLLTGHELMLERIPDCFRYRIKAVMFNLGYLPRTEKTVITDTTTTLRALNAAIEALADFGRISIVAYTGHPGGKDETLAVKMWVNKLASNAFRVDIKIPASLGRAAPELILIEKRDSVSN